MERLAAADPADLELSARARARWEEFTSRRDGYQLLFFVTPREVYDSNLIFERLAEMDVRRYGGAHGFWKRWVELEEEKERRAEQARRDRIHDELGDAYDRLKAGRKDWYAGGEMDGRTPYVPKPKPPEPSESLTSPFVVESVEE